MPADRAPESFLPGQGFCPTFHVGRRLLEDAPPPLHLRAFPFPGFLPTLPAPKRHTGGGQQLRKLGGGLETLPPRGGMFPVIRRAAIVALASPFSASSSLVASASSAPGAPLLRLSGALASASLGPARGSDARLSTPADPPAALLRLDAASSGPVSAWDQGASRAFFGGRPSSGSQAPGFVPCRLGAPTLAPYHPVGGTATDGAKRYPPYGLAPTMAFAQAVGSAMAHQQLLLPSRQVKIGFIGAGQMAEAMAKSWHVSGVVPAASMFCTDVNLDRRRVFESFGVTSLDNCRQVAEKSDVLILAVKPPGVKPVLTELRQCLEERHLVVSIAAGVTISSMQAWAGPNVRMVRVMPNTACIVGATASAMAAGPKATAADACLVRSLFAAVGTIHEVPESLLDAVTGLSGSGPAYVFMLIEAMADGGVAAGLPRDMAISLAAQTAFGASKMVLETGKHPAQLKDSVASPQGTTIAGVHELEKGNFRASVMNAVISATNRSKDLSNVNSVHPNMGMVRPKKMMKMMKGPDPGQQARPMGEEGEVVPALEFGDAEGRGGGGDGMDNGLLDGGMPGASGGHSDMRRKSRIVVCKSCGGNHYKKTACRPAHGGVGVE